MNRKFISIVVLAAVFLAGVPAWASMTDFSIHSNTRYESHNIAGPTSDNSMTQTFTFGWNTGYRSNVAATLGYKYDLDDGESANTLFGLSYLHSFSKSSFFLTNYSNHRTSGHTEDFQNDDTLDALYFMHGWKLIKRHNIQMYLKTSITADTGFDDNREWAETIQLGGNVHKKIKWRLAYRYGHSMVSDSHSTNNIDLGFSVPLYRYGNVSLMYRWVDYLSQTAGGTDTDDDIWIIAYRHRLR